jgi:hypothetical protein
MKKLDKGPRSSFAEDAERLDAAVREIKNKQLADVHGVPQQPPLKGPTAAETWSRNYATQSISPRVGVMAPANMTPMPHSTFVLAESSPPRVAVPNELKRAAPVDRAPMSVRIGKFMERRRSWLGRLLRG